MRKERFNNKMLDYSPRIIFFRRFNSSNISSRNELSPPPALGAPGCPPPPGAELGGPPPPDGAFGGPELGAFGGPDDGALGGPPPPDGAFGGPELGAFGGPPAPDGGEGKFDFLGGPELGAFGGPDDGALGGPPPPDDAFGGPPPEDGGVGAFAPADAAGAELAGAACLPLNKLNKVFAAVDFASPAGATTF
jgi:hypothetical protein